MIDLGINLFQEIAALGGGGGFSITNSLRFNDNDSAYLSRTPSVAGDRKTWTWSGWVKRGNLGGTLQVIFSNHNGSPLNGHGELYFDASDVLWWSSTDNNVTYTFNYVTNQVFRDVGGWYHIVLQVDTTQATASNRIKIYVNGSQVTSFSSATDPSLNYDTPFNRATQHELGSLNYTGGGNYFDGYMAEVNFIDGQALTADDFGQIDATTGEWSPKKYSGTYGTNGFYLPFNGNANDSSGNSNNWTENNLASTDYMIDTPTNNFAVFNPLANGGGTLSEGNLKLTGASAAWGARLSTIAVSSGKWYAEITPTSGSATQGIMFGISNYITAPSSYIGSASTSYGYYGFDGGLYSSGVKTAGWGATVADNDIVGIALDMDAGTLKLYKNNVQQGTTITGLSGLFYIGVSCYGTATANINFGQDSSFAGNKTRQGNTDSNGIGDFYYTPPTGFLALCTDNLPAPAIEQPETQFNVVTYTGDGASSRSITGVGFQPDFVWIKVRNATTSHNVYDVNRGINKALFTNLTSAESDRTSAGGGLVSFDADGFSTGADIGTSTGLNNSGNSYVAWCWKAGGTAVTNTDGTITSQVSANVDAGFSIVGYTGNGSSGVSIGHGLNQAPDIIIVKDRDSGTYNWAVTGDAVGLDKVLYLNTTNAVITNSGYHPLPDATKINYGTSWPVTNVNGNNYIAYCFHSVEGFSKIGTYVGNGSADGPFVYTGFKPAFVLYKRAVGGTGNWILADNKREGYNWDNPTLYPNLTNAESSGSSIDILSNGFKVNNAVAGADHNASGSTYIYMAFAEHPFKEALAR